MITFQKVTPEHKETILKWFQEEHVKAFFYEDGLKSTLNNLDLFCENIDNNGRYTFYHWIAFYDNIPFAFIMTSPLQGPYDSEDDYDKWYREGKKTVTLDLLIGNQAFLGKGLAHLMIQQFILSQYSEVDFFIIDPELANTKAIHVYEKAGFEKVAEFYPATNPKPHIMMHLEVRRLKAIG